MAGGDGLMSQRSNRITPPRVFISYSHDSADHRQRILEFANRLRREGVDAELDWYDQAPAAGWLRWMQQEIQKARFVVIVVTENYRSRFEGTEKAGIGLGANAEGVIITQEIYDTGGQTTKFIPCAFEGADLTHCPTVLRPFTRYEVGTEEGYERLYRLLTDQPEVEKPPLGERRRLSPLPERPPQPAPQRHRNATAALDRQTTSAEPIAVLRQIEEQLKKTADPKELYQFELGLLAIARQLEAATERTAQLRQSLFDHLLMPSLRLVTELDFLEAPNRQLWTEIPAGSFEMGSSQGSGQANEHPQHTVAFQRPFRISRVPITNRLYQVFDPSHRSSAQGSAAETADHPVTQVSWYAAVSFCRWLSRTLPEHFAGARLPTEEEWEYACRAGTTLSYWSGDTKEDLARAGWYLDNSDDRTHRVGEKPANPWGLYDMHGNVAEWTATIYETDAYAKRPTPPWVADSPAVSKLLVEQATDPNSPRVVRGGGYWHGAEAARSAYRSGRPPETEDLSLGFRVVIPSR